MASKSYDIVLLPDEQTNNLAYEVSARLASSYDTIFTLQEGFFYPHISLYMLQLRDDSLLLTNDILQKIADSTSALSLQAKEYHQQYGYIDIEYAASSAAQALQQIVIEYMNPVRDGLREKDKARLTTATGLELENIQNYGYRSVGQLFAPHITLTRFTSHFQINESRLPVPSEFNGTFPQIGIFEMGENGTCVCKVATFALG